MRLVWKNRLGLSAPSSTDRALTATSSDHVRSGGEAGTGSPEPTSRDKPPDGVY